MIQINNLNFKYKNGQNVLQDINLKINNESLCIIGKNGSGKSTLLKLIAGLLKPTSGEIIIDNNLENIRKKVGIVFQNPENQILFSNVYDDLIFALNNLSIDNKEQRIKVALEKVKMSEYINANTYELSLGQKQRIAIAGVLAVNPDYLIFDEPTTMLDSEGKQDVYDIISLLKNKYTIIYASNVMDEILLADRIAIIDNSEIVSIFNKQDILKNTNLLIKYGFKLPIVVQILLNLKEQNININLENWTIEELSQKIAGAIKT